MDATAGQQTNNPTNNQLSIDELMAILFENLKSQVATYKKLADLVKAERELLLSADIEELQKNNLQKETIIYKLRNYDVQRERIAKEVALKYSCEPRLLEIAKKAKPVDATNLKDIHKQLDSLISSIVTINKENEIYAQSGLQMMNGALDEIKGTLAGKPTYARHGKNAYGPEKSGNLVRKEA